MKQVKLYNHNKTTYENITRIFETSNKCATVQPTGSGKSFLIFKLAQDNSDKTIIVFEPNRQIISRVSEQMKEYGIDNIKFYTYQKLNSQHKRDEISITNADYICLDELHRIKAKQWEQAVIAIQEKFPNAKVLGLTATPERMDGQNIIDYFGAELACNITLGDAIVNRILPCPTYISALYTFDDEIQRVNNKIDESRNSDEEKEEMREELKVARKQLENALGVPTILKKHIPDSKGKYIIFCQNVEHLNTMESTIENWFTQAGFNVHMYAVHTKNSNHKTEYNEFKVDNSDCIKLCLCVDMFNEGVHLEGVSGVILLRPTQSSIVYLQQIGRAISASDENVPIIFDLVNNGNSLGCGSLRAEIESAVERHREEIAECSDSECDKEVVDIGSFHIYDYVKDSLDVLNNIENKCTDSWMDNYYLSYEYIKLFNISIKQRTVYKNHNIGKWLNNNKQYYKKGNLSQEKISLLKTICDLNKNIDDIRDDKWNEMFDILSKYLKQGNTLKTNTVYQDANIGYWYGTQLTNYHNGLLAEWKISKLQSINLLKSKFDELWFKKYEISLDYVNKYGKTIKSNTTYKNYNIGQWKMDNLKKIKTGRLSKDKLELLKNIYDFNDNKQNKNQSQWDFNFTLISEYITNEGIITSDSIYKNFKLGMNIRAWKQRYKQGKFPEERYQQLLSLGIDLAKEGSLM